MDEDGYFFIVDRKKDLINASGFKVSPREDEEVLYTHPDIKEAAVVGVKDEYRGETVKAFVVLKDKNRNPGEESIRAYCKTKLAPYKVPKIVEFRDELPKTLIGKVLRRRLREEEENAKPAEKRETRWQEEIQQSSPSVLRLIPSIVGLPLRPADTFLRDSL